MTEFKQTSQPTTISAFDDLDLTPAEVEVVVSSFRTDAPRPAFIGTPKTAQSWFQEMWQIATAIRIQCPDYLDEPWRPALTMPSKLMRFVCSPQPLPPTPKLTLSPMGERLIGWLADAIVADILAGRFGKPDIKDIFPAVPVIAEEAEDPTDDWPIKIVDKKMT